MDAVFYYYEWEAYRFLRLVVFFAAFFAVFFLAVFFAVFRFTVFFLAVFLVAFLATLRAFFFVGMTSDERLMLLKFDRDIFSEKFFEKISACV